MSRFEARLPNESAGWVADGIITGEQRRILLERHPESRAGGGRLVAILGALGGALVLTGVCLLISSNWQLLHDWVKIGGLVILQAGAYGAGWRLKFNPGAYPRVGDAFFLVGAGLFLAGIALVSQIFHINIRPAAGVLMGWVGIVAVPWLTGSKPVQLLSVSAGLVWLSLEFTTPGSVLAVLDDPHSGPAFWLLTALSVPVGLTVTFAGQALRASLRPDFAGMHEKLGLLIASVALYVLGFLRHGWTSTLEAVAAPPLIVVCGLLGAGLWLAGRARPGELRALLPFIAPAALPVAAVVLGWNLGDGGWLWSATAWMALFGVNLGMVRMGLASGREGWANLGLMFIALNIVTRYFDLFGSMLEGGVFFVLTGVVILIVGFSLERKRRDLLRGMRQERRAS